MKKKQFEKICRLGQADLKKYLDEKLSQNYGVFNEDGFLYAQGSLPVLLVAHMDTVHKQAPHEILYENGKISSPQGIGGDDRCGIFMILEIIQNYNCSVLFTEDEEIGGIGAEKFIRTELGQSLVSSFNFIIEFDRKGSNDAVFYNCDNMEFEDFITKDFFKTNYGSFSDISVIAPELKVAAVNLSCGYYNAHTTNEYVVWDEMMKVIEEASFILDQIDDTKYEYIEGAYYDDYSYYGIMGRDDYGCETVWYIEYERNGKIGITEVYAISEAEAIGMFLMENNDLTYGSVLFMERY